MTKLPFFREVVLMAFECPHCGFRRAAADAHTSGLHAPREGRVNRRPQRQR